MYEAHIETITEMLWAPGRTPRETTALSAASALMRKSAAAQREELERARMLGRTEGYEAAADEVRDCNAHAEAYKADAERIESVLRHVCEAAEVLLAKRANHPPSVRAPLEHALAAARSASR